MKESLKANQSNGSGVMVMSKKRELWTPAKKREAVLRLLKGESLDELSRAIHVPAHKLSGWRDSFLEAGLSGLKTHKRLPSEDKLRKAEAKIGQLTMKLELLEKKDELLAMARAGKLKRL